MRIVGIIIFWLAMVVFLYGTRRSRNVAFWPLLALACLLLFNLFFTQQFYRLELREGSFFGIPVPQLYGVPIDILNHASKVGILAIGMTLVIAVGGIDLSVGAVMAIAGAMMATLSVQLGVSPAACIAAALAAGLAAGMWNGFLVAVMGIPPMVATLILMVAGRGVAQLVTDGQIIIFNNPILTSIGNAFLLVPVPFLLMLLMLIATWITTRGTALGFLIEAVGDNEVASSRAGVSARTLKFLVYVFCGFCSAVAGLVQTSNIRSADANNIGLTLELDAIMAVVIGGTAMTGGRFYLASSVAGALLIQALTTTMYAKDVSPVVAPVPKALVILAVCLLQSERVRRLFIGRRGTA
ncbi:MAG: ABC transporter permease [Planctomycetota bacterium]|jgi:simple sugar transport system permease protein|nr:ABC transporter permease [Planctomycetota bacterium]